MSLAAAALRFAIALLAVTAAACDGDDDAPATPDAGPQPTPGVCIPGPNGTGNDLHVGAHCTSGGQQCAAYSAQAILLCSIDLDPEGDEFCIKVGCSSHDDCGEQGCCTGRPNNSPKACVPKGCLTAGDLAASCPAIPYADAGQPRDAGSSTVADGG